MRVTEGVRKIIVEWHGKGVPPEETARSLRIPIDEVKAIILQAHPAPAPENPPASATIEEKVKESQQTVENKRKVSKPLKTSRSRPIHHVGNGFGKVKAPTFRQRLALSNKRV